MTDQPTPPSFDQFALFPYDSLRAVQAEPAAQPRNRRRRSFDVAILRYLSFYRFATTHQVITRFWSFAGKSPKWGYQVIHNLIQDGLVEQTPLDPDLGRQSRAVLSLSRLGWAAVGVPVPKDWSAAAPSELREYRLQFTETMLCRNADGWRLLPTGEEFEALRQATLTRMRSQTLVGVEEVLRDAVRRAPKAQLGTWALRHSQTQAVRIGLAVRRGKSLLTLLSKLPPLGMFSPLELEIVASSPDQLDEARDIIARWASEHKLAAQVHAAAPYRSRRNPSEAGATRDNLYAAAGIADVREFVA